MPDDLKWLLSLSVSASSAYLHAFIIFTCHVFLNHYFFQFPLAWYKNTNFIWLGPADVFFLSIPDLLFLVYSLLAHIIHIILVYPLFSALALVSSLLQLCHAGNCIWATAQTVTVNDWGPLAALCQFQTVMCKLIFVY
jgi:hypothetical protein